MLKRSLLVLALLAVPAAADTPTIKGTFGFDVYKSNSSKCVAITGAMLTKVTKSYVCVAPADPKSTSSGVAYVATCTAKQGQSELMLFANLKDCENERATQAANG